MGLQQRLQFSGAYKAHERNGQTRATNLEPPVRDRGTVWPWFIRSTRSGIESSSINLDRPGQNRTTHIAISVTYAFPRKSQRRKAFNASKMPYLIAAPGFAVEARSNYLFFLGTFLPVMNHLVP